MAWVRKGYWYRSVQVTVTRDGWKLAHTYYLGFFAYHLIRWIHGEEKLKEMEKR